MIHSFGFYIIPNYYKSNSICGDVDLISKQFESASRPFWSRVAILCPNISTSIGNYFKTIFFSLIGGGIKNLDKGVMFNVELLTKQEYDKFLFNLWLNDLFDVV